MKNEREAGSILRRKKDFVWHYGVQLEGDNVIHFAPGNSEQIVSYETFASGKKVEVITTSVDRATLQQRVMQVLNAPSTYRLCFNNCEHLKNFLIYGTKESKQVQRAIAFGSMGALIGSAKNRPIAGLVLGGLLGLLTAS